MKSTALRVVSTLLALAFLIPSLPVLAAPPAPGPGTALIQGEITALFYQTSALAFASGLTQGERTSLVAKLIHAKDALGRGNDSAAINNLESFINELNALEQSGRLGPDDAATLRAQARLIVTQIANLPA